MMACDEIDDLLPGLALGAASRDEQREVEQHLASCDRHPQLADFQEVAAMLPLTVPPVRPRIEVKHRLMARVYTDLEPASLRPRWWQRTRSWAVAAVLAVLALGLGIRDWLVSNQLATAPLSWQLAPTAAGIRAAGTLVYIPQQRSATLMLRQLDQLPADRVYEVWLIRVGKPEPAAVFRSASDGSASVIVKGAPGGFDTVAVTEEPGPGGSAAPTSQPFVAGALR